MVALLVAGELADPHKTKHKTMKRILLAAVVALIVAAWLDVQTGVDLLDGLIRAVPIDWPRGLIQ